MSSLRDKRSSRTEAARPAPAARPAEVVIGRFVGVAEDGAPLVDFPGNPAGGPVPALATARYDDVPPGAPVALMFLDGDRARPLAIGVIAQPDARVGDQRPDRTSAGRTPDADRGARDRAAMRPCQHRFDACRQGAGAGRLRVAAVVGDAAHHRRIRADQLNDPASDESAQRSGMAAGYTVGLDKTGAEHVVVAVKGTFTMPKRGDAPRLADEQVPLVDADQFTGEPGRSATLVECDYALQKPRCDVLLNGAAYAPGGRPVERIAVGLQVGEWRKSFAVWGNRVWRGAAVGYAPSEPEPFERMPISYDNAFGGTDERMRDPAQARSYLPNPVGRGWHHHIHRELVVGAPVSNTEEINDPVRDPGGKYQPMAFGPIGRGWPSRIGHAGTYDQNWIDNVFPFLPDDFDTRYFQSAPEDQQIAYPRGGEPVVLVNLTSDGRREFALPSVEMPIVFFRRRADRVATKGTLDTLLFEPDAERFSMVWRATLRLQRDIFEVPQAVMGRMSRGWWRAVQQARATSQWPRSCVESGASGRRLMPGRRLPFWESGLVSGVGLTAETSCAAIRCGINNFQETQFIGSDGNWLIGSAVQLEQPWRGITRLTKMAARAIAECLAVADDTPANIPILRLYRGGGAARSL